MNEAPLDVLDPQRSQLRKLAAAVDQQVASLGSEDLKLAWLALSKALALGEEPQLRSCPNCGRMILPEATRCRYCMAQSEPSATGRRATAP